MDGRQNDSLKNEVSEDRQIWIQILATLATKCVRLEKLFNLPTHQFSCLLYQDRANSCFTGLL